MVLLFLFCKIFKHKHKQTQINKNVNPKNRSGIYAGASFHVVIEHDELEVKLKDATNPMSATSLRGLVEQIMKVWSLIPIGQVEEADVELTPEDFTTPVPPATTSTTTTNQYPQIIFNQSNIQASPQPSQLLPLPKNNGNNVNNGPVYQNVLSQDRLAFFLQELRLDNSVSLTLARNHITFDILVNLSADDLIQIGIDSHSAMSIFYRLKAIQTR